MWPARGARHGRSSRTERAMRDRIEPNEPSRAEPSRAEPSRVEPNQTGLCRAEPLNHSNGNGFTELSCNLQQYSKGGISCPVKKTSFIENSLNSIHFYSRGDMSTLVCFTEKPEVWLVRLRFPFEVNMTEDLGKYHLAKVNKVISLLFV